METRRKVVITDGEVITPLGVGLELSWKKLIEGKSGIDRITLFDTSSFKCKIAGECRDFVPENFLDRKLISRYDRMFQFFIAVALLMREKGNFSFKDPYKVSVIGGSATGTPLTFEYNYDLLKAKGPRKVSPFCVINVVSNTVANEVAKIFGAKGPLYFLQESCATGTKVIGLAKKLIETGVIDVAIVIASDAGICPTLIASLENLGAIVDSRWNEEPQKASRPFDKLRSGFVPSEGAGCLILEEFNHAVKRGVNPLVEVAGFGATCDAYHPTAPEPEAKSIIECIKMALKDANTFPEEIEYINAHGTSTVLNDITETKAIKEVFKQHAYKIPISSNKSMIGHMWGAAGIVETAFSVKTLIEGIIPPTINLENPDPECDLDYVPNKSRVKQINTVLKNSFGFGGINATLVLRKIT